MFQNVFHFNRLPGMQFLYIILHSLHVSTEYILKNSRYCPIPCRELVPRCHTCTTNLTNSSNLEKSVVYEYNICLVFQNLTVEPQKMSLKRLVDTTSSKW